MVRYLKGRFLLRKRFLRKKFLRNVARARTFYVLTDETQQQTSGFPLKFIPVVNQTTANLEFYYAVDPDESRFLMLYSTWNSAMKQIYTKILPAFKKAPLSENMYPSIMLF